MDDRCNRCGLLSEDVLHCFRDCPEARESSDLLIPVGLLIPVALWWIWRARCQQVFQPDDPWSHLKVAGLSRSLLNDLFSSSQVWNRLMLAWEAGCKRVICETDCLEDWVVKFVLINRDANTVAGCMAKKSAHSAAPVLPWRQLTFFDPATANTAVVFFSGSANTDVASWQETPNINAPR
ncbi:hypothetical protein PIB30_004037 [Stylosanthes scabra]|uniref:Reverse transcriptase zinc-binding domain-containing protein n=1 Tax=Stylosanthes scabra TaxID=79078 RepID=A0ABU6Y089_9FABA|nr:hypothetical protein [Stylosanthes scabra]